MTKRRIQIDHFFAWEFLDILTKCKGNLPKEILDIVRNNFDEVYSKGVLYRSTGVVLSKLASGECSQPDLFGGTLQADAMKKVYLQIDKMDEKYGKHTIFLGSSFLAMNNPAHKNERGEKVQRVQFLLKGETGRRHIGIPMLGEVS